MARLRRGQKEQIASDVHRLLRRHYNGLRESEIAELTGLDRRRLNNYLRELQAKAKVYKDGREWYAE